jgi:hypothetical protein
MPSTEPVEMEVPNAYYTNSTGIGRFFIIRSVSSAAGRTAVAGTAYLRLN